MVSHSISGPTVFVTISTGDRAVVLGMSLMQPVFAFEFARTCAPNMSKSSCTPIIFWVRCMYLRLRLSYERDVLLHLNKELDHRRL